MAHQSSHTNTPQTSGHVIHSLARVYDLMVWVFLRGREPALREKMDDLAGLKPGEAARRGLRNRNTPYLSKAANWRLWPRLRHRSLAGDDRHGAKKGQEAWRRHYLRGWNYRVAAVSRCILRCR